MDKIGIKLANSEFYPILDHGTPAKKRLVVTTVNDRQKSVQIDLYRGEGPMVDDAVYVGSLVVEEIPEGQAGEPDIRLDIELDESDMLKCTAIEAETGTSQSIRVSLETLGEENSYEIPDFDLGGEETEEETDDLPSEATSPEEGASLLAAAAELRDSPKGRPVLLWALGALVVILLAAIGWFFIFGGHWGGRSPSSESSAATAAPTAPPASLAPAATQPMAATQQSAASATAATAPAAASSPASAAPIVEAQSSSQGKRYRIKWGDTLWDLSWAYYRDPWLYPRIAKANRIRNPDRILAGTWIVIPPR